MEQFLNYTVPARFRMMMVNTRFSSLAVNLPQRTSTLPMQVTHEITQTAARNKVLSSKWDNDDTPA